MIENTQQLINKIHDIETPIDDLLTFLLDQRGVVRANVLFELVNRDIRDDKPVVAALVDAATNKFSNFKLMGNITQRKFAIATIAWINGASSEAVYSEMLSECDKLEEEDIRYLVSQGPVCM